jgi:hypothetical protein
MGSVRQHHEGVSPTEKQEETSKAQPSEKDYGGTPGPHGI